MLCSCQFYGLTRDNGTREEDEEDNKRVGQACMGAGLTLENSVSSWNICIQ